METQVKGIGCWSSLCSAQGAYVVGVAAARMCGLSNDLLTLSYLPGLGKARSQKTWMADRRAGSGKNLDLCGGLNDNVSPTGSSV